MKWLFSFFLKLIFIALFVWIIGFTAFISATFLPPQKSKQGTELTVVLTGGEGRVKKSIELFEQDLTEQIFVSGVHPNSTKKETIGPYLVGLNIEDTACCIHIGQNSRNTFENAQETKAWIEESAPDLQEFRLLTSNVHMPRAALEFYAAMPDKAIILHPIIYPSLNEVYSSPAMWNFMHLEYLKTWVVLGRIATNGSEPYKNIMKSFQEFLASVKLVPPPHSSSFLDTEN